MNRICVPVCARSIDQLRDAIERAAQVADIIELRLDCLENLETVSQALGQVSNVERPLIVTLRSVEQGGHSAVDYEARRRFWSVLAPPAGDSLFDLEHDLVQNFSAAKSSGGLKAHWKQIICSHHDFSGVPKDLTEIYEAMAATPAGIIKIAVQANDATDCLPIFALIDRARREERELIGIAMGPAGIMTRVLGPSRGSFLTYGSLDDESATAPGQLTGTQLRGMYQIDRIKPETEVLGIVGSPVSQSWSPDIHNAAFVAGGLDAVYLPFETRDVSEFIRRMAHPKTREIDWNLRGLSVTIPHKSAVMPWLDHSDPIAAEIGAVNTIVVSDDRLLGYNTDAEGFIAPLLRRLGPIRNARCAVIGAGGAARAVVWALHREGAIIELFARQPETSTITAGSFGVACHQLSGADFAGFDIVVNTTPLGTAGANQDLTPATAAQLQGVRLAYDLVYNPIDTLFLREARAAGCDTLAGLEMLLAQGVEQFRLWTGKEPDTEVMRAAALSRLAS